MNKRSIIVYIGATLSALFGCASCQKEEKRDRGKLSEEDPDAFQNYILPHEDARELYSLQENVFIHDAMGNIAGELRKGFLVKDPSMFDLGDVDLGDNDRITISISLPDRSILKRKGLLKELAHVKYMASKNKPGT